MVTGARSEMQSHPTFWPIIVLQVKKKVQRDENFGQV